MFRNPQLIVITNEFISNLLGTNTERQQIAVPASRLFEDKVPGGAGTWMLPGACYSERLKQKATQVPACFIPLGPAEGEGGGGRRKEQRVWCGRKGISHRSLTMPGSSQPTRSCSVSYVTETAGTGSDGEKTWRKAVVFPVASLTESAFKSHEDESSGKPNKAKHTHKRTT